MSFADLIETASLPPGWTCAGRDSTLIGKEVRCRVWRPLNASLTEGDRVRKRQAEVFYAAQYRSVVAVDTARSALSIAEGQEEQNNLDVEASSADLSIAMGRT